MIRCARTSELLNTIYVELCSRRSRSLIIQPGPKDSDSAWESPLLSPGCPLLQVVPATFYALDGMSFIPSFP